MFVSRINDSKEINNLLSGNVIRTTVEFFLLEKLNFGFSKVSSLNPCKHGCAHGED